MRSDGHWGVPTSQSETSKSFEHRRLFASNVIVLGGDKRNMDNMRRGNNPKRSRNGRPNGRGHGGGGGKPPMGMNRSMESNTPDGNKVRGNASQLYERYTMLARDAQSAGDRILAEGYLQYAEHYYRVLSAAGLNRRPPNG